jgi:hypothetical protein
LFTFQTYLFFSQKLKLSEDGSDYSCYKCFGDLLTCLSIKNRFQVLQPRNNANKFVEVKSNPENFPSWSLLPPELWLLILEQLDSADLSPVHLVSKKLHGLANKQKHKLDLARLLQDENNVQRFRKSSRLYKEIHAYSFKITCPKFFKIFKTLKVAGKYVKHLEFDDLFVNPIILDKLLTNLPNLETLCLNSLDFDGWDGLSEYPKFQLKNLQKVSMKKSSNSFYMVFENFSCPALTEIEIGHMDFEFEPFIEANARTVKKLVLECSNQSEDDESDDPDFPDYSSLFSNLQDAAFDFLQLSSMEIDPPVFMQFLKIQIGLKHLSLNHFELDGEIMGVICNSLQGLEVLKLINYRGASIEDFTDLHKLRNLRSLSITNDEFDYHVLDGLMSDANSNLTELEVNDFDAATLQFLNNLSASIPNLKRLKIDNFDKELLKRYLAIFRKLEALEFKEYEPQFASYIFNDVKLCKSNLKKIVFSNSDGLELLVNGSIQ